jgi:hypothetical protein
MTSISAACKVACFVAAMSSPTPKPFLSIILASGINITDNK